MARRHPRLSGRRAAAGFLSLRLRAGASLQLQLCSLGRLLPESLALAPARRPVAALLMACGSIVQPMPMLEVRMQIYPCPLHSRDSCALQAAAAWALVQHHNPAALQGRQLPVQVQVQESAHPELVGERPLAGPAAAVPWAAAQAALALRAAVARGRRRLLRYGHPCPHKLQRELLLGL